MALALALAFNVKFNQKKTPPPKNLSTRLVVIFISFYNCFEYLCIYIVIKIYIRDRYIRGNQEKKKKKRKKKDREREKYD